MNDGSEALARDALKAPSEAELVRYAARRNLRIAPDEMPELLARIEVELQAFQRLHDIEQPRVTLRYPGRDPGWVPSAAEDPHGAATRFCDVKGAVTGPLAGMRIGVKDNIAVAGVPMAIGATGGSFTPSEDAVVVERLLDAGAAIVAKTVIDSTVEVRNPLDRRFSPGGSSSGSAVAVATGLVDAALGADQGGSIRTPAAWCGLVGMKATHGLVPSYGLLYWDHTLDNIGPMTRTVAENAALLSVLAGSDWRNPQCAPGTPTARDYGTTLEQGAEGLRIGVVAESLDPAICTGDTIEVVQEAHQTLRRLGAEVTHVSVPLWAKSDAIWYAVTVSGVTTMTESFGQGYSHPGRIDVDRLVTTARQTLAGDPPQLLAYMRTMMLTYEHLRETAFGVHFAWAQNLRLELRRQVDALFEHVDLLVTPTWPTGPDEFVDESSPEVKETGNPALSKMSWTTPFNLTGHPALTVPAGVGEDGMPRGLQIIGRRFDEHTVYRAGAAFEAARSDS